jgi:hypothetical protein
MEFKMKHRNFELSVIIKKDPNIIRTKITEAKRGKGRKNRPRKSNRSLKEKGHNDILSLVF